MQCSKAAQHKEAHRQIGPPAAARWCPWRSWRPAPPDTPRKLHRIPRPKAFPKDMAHLAAPTPDGVHRQGPGGVVQLAAENAQGRHQRGPQNIPQVGQRPVTQQLPHRPAPVQQGDGQHAVAGKQLRPGDHYQPQAEGEQQGADRPEGPGVRDAVGGGVGGGAGPPR